MLRVFFKVLQRDLFWLLSLVLDKDTFCSFLGLWWGKQWCIALELRKMIYWEIGSSTR